MPRIGSFGTSSAKSLGFTRRGLSIASDAISRIADATTRNVSNSGTLSINVPSGTLTGDLMIAVVSSSSGTNSNWTTPSGWTLVEQAGVGSNLAVFYRTATTEPGSYSFTFSRTNSILGGTIYTFRNCIFGGKSNVINTNSGAASQDRTALGGTVNFNKSTALSIFASENSNETYTTPSGWTSLGTNSAASGPSWVTFSQDFSSTFTLSNATTLLSASTNSSTSSLQIFLISKNSSLLNSYTERAYAATSFTTTQVETLTISNASGTITPPAGVTLSKNSGAYTSAATPYIVGDTFKFRVTSPASVNQTATYELLFVGSDSTSTRYDWIVDTATYVLLTLSQTFTTPQGVNAISMLAVGGGGGAYGDSNGVNSFGAAGGGALSYSNNVAVTSGETLTIVVGSGGTGGAGNQTGTPGSLGTNGGDSSIARGATTLVLAKGGLTAPNNTRTGALGGQSASGVGTVKFNGGQGGTSVDAATTSESGPSGGGAATPAGNGPTGLWRATAAYSLNGNPISTAGWGGYGINFTSTGWAVTGFQTSSTAFREVQFGEDTGTAYGGAAGCDWAWTAKGNYFNGEPGGQGCVVMIWGGRTFSSASTY